MDLSEAELMRIFDDIEDADDANDDPMNEVSEHRTVVTVNYEVDCANILQSSLNHLGVTLQQDDQKEILREITNLAALSSKTAMMRQYVSVMTRKFGTPELSEVTAKRIMKSVIPQIIDASFPISSYSPDSSSQQHQIQTGVVQYLAGSLLRWGIRKLKGERNAWCRSQIDRSVDLHPLFEGRNRGSLLKPHNGYTAMILRTEVIVSKYLGHRHICYAQIISSVNPSKFFPEADPILLKMILTRYINLRLHIHCREKLNYNPTSKQPKSCSLRKSLKILSK